MRRLIWLFLISVSFAQTAKVGPQKTVGPNTIPGATPLTFTLVQHPNLATCTGTTCAPTITSTTATNLLLDCNTAYSNNSADAISSITLTGETGWTQVPSLNQTVLNAAAGNFYAIDCYYKLSAAGGSSGTPSALWNKTQVLMSSEFFEIQRSAGSWALDTSAGTTKTTCTTCAGASVPSIGAGPDYCIQVAAGSGNGVISAITGSYTSPFDHAAFNTGVSAGYAYAGWNGANANTIPNYTQSPTDTVAVGAVCFK